MRTGWKKGRILITRLLLVPLVVLVIITGHVADDHGLFDLMLSAAGLFLVHMGIRGRVWAMLFIGGRKDGTLVTEGPYSITRNPLYFYSGLAVMGIAAATGMLLAVVIISAIFGVICHFTIKAEEKKLRMIHGDDFTSYCAKVPRFFPVRSRVIEPPLRTFSPELFHRTYRDATWFLVAWLAVVAVHLLQATGNLHALWELH